MIFIGLLVELLAEKKWFKSLKSLRRWEFAKKFAEWTVIVGIVAEVADAGWTAHEISAAKNAARNQPIVNIEAFVDLMVSGSKENKPADADKYFLNGTVANLDLYKSKNDFSFSYFPKLIADKYMLYVGATNREYFIKFHPKLNGEGISLDGLTKSIDDIQSAKINVDFLSAGENSSGFVIISINSLKKTFRISPQNDVVFDHVSKSGVTNFSAGIPYFLLATNLFEPKDLVLFHLSETNFDTPGMIDVLQK